MASLQDPSRLPALEARLTQLGVPRAEWPMLGAGQEGVIACATEDAANVVVTGIVGCAGLLPTVEAIKVGGGIGSGWMVFAGSLLCLGGWGFPALLPLLPSRPPSPPLIPLNLDARRACNVPSHQVTLPPVPPPSSPPFPLPTPPSLLPPRHARPSPSRTRRL